jgi:hypothetical protein
VYAFYDKVESLNTYSDQELAPYVPYYYQASVQLGSPEAYDGYLRDLLRYPGTDVLQTFVPKSVPLPHFDYLPMPDIDFWVRSRGTRMQFIYGENDPWSAEPFELGSGSQDSTATSCPVTTTAPRSRNCQPIKQPRRPRQYADGPAYRLRRKRPPKRWRLKDSPASAQTC